MQLPNYMPIHSSILMNTKDKPTFSQAVIEWQKNHGRHNLPWQQQVTPYKVWLSETMLQQTQVKTVIPYFIKFMDAFPKITDLALASDDTVMQLWAGLGYYSRARNLHQTAKLILNTYNGTFPNEYDQIIQLPGIGRSTAGAILSLGFKKSYPILDGNVKRIFARLFELDTPINQTNSQNKLWQYAEKLLPDLNASVYNQGLMDLGALICTKNTPSCLICPVNNHCQAFQNNSQLAYPVKAAKRIIPTKTLSFLVIQSKYGLILKKRPPKGIWGGLWSLPNYSDYPFLEEKTPNKISDTFTHKFTHFKLIYNFLYYQSDELNLEKDLFIDYKKLNEYALPKPMAQFIADEFN